MFARRFRYGTHVARMAVNMDGNYRPCFAGDFGLDLARVHLPCVGQAVDEHRHSAKVRDGIYGSYISEGGDDYLVSPADAEGS
jgi:hypothetical protein